MADRPHLNHRDPSTGDASNPHASASQWRHQESSAFARAAVSHDGHSARDAHTASANTSGLSGFLNRSRIDHDRPATSTSANYQPITIGASTDGANGTAVDLPAGNHVVCGPLLNYRRMEGRTWHGSVLVVVKGGGKIPPPPPKLNLGRVDVASTQEGFLGQGPASNGLTAEDAGTWSAHGAQVDGNCLYSDPRATFWAFPLACDMADTESKWAYSISDVTYESTTKPRTNFFFVPSFYESMRIMFHSCNGFSVGTDEEAWSGACLWNDVMRTHGEAPFHVMLGGGDQIYNDGIRVNGPLRQWTDIGNPKKRRDYPFPEGLRHDCDNYYLDNYIRWYSTEPFAVANGQIPQLNIWDDHDIIDGFGSYVNDFMKCDVFRGIGGVAHKYYLLFQHHIPPPPSTYTTDAPETLEHGPAHDSAQLRDAFVAPQGTPDPSYIVGAKPGPYVAEHSMNMFTQLGARIAFMGIDARTERTRHRVNYEETYDLIFDRVKAELKDAQEASRPYKHLILLLGIPIAYPRLTWLENIFSSPLIAPIKFLNRRFGFGGGVFNHFDGSVDLLDDLDDHYTAKTHKKERNALVERLQTLASEFSTRVTILGGDVHLAALGRFYSNPNLHIPVEADHRYIVNVVSSAIVNKPPPAAVANLLASRNKIHHLNADTDETLMKLFDKDPGQTNKTAGSNHCTMPSRNFSVITENSPNGHGTLNGAANGGANGAEHEAAETENLFRGRDGHSFLHKGEESAGTQHRASSMATHGRSNDGSLDVCIRVEVDQSDSEGKTEPYGLTIPALEYEAGKYGSNVSTRHGIHGHRSRPDTGVSQARRSTASGAASARAASH